MGNTPTYTSPSTIHGQGTFAARSFEVGDHILTLLHPDRPAGTRVAAAGKYVNHCWDVRANAAHQPCGSDICLVAARYIAQDDEICTNYDRLPTWIKRADAHWS